MEVKQAVILAGGYGTRLKPFTNNNPKPMYQLEGKPFLEYLIIQIKSFGIQRVLLLLGYMPEKIMDYFGNGHKWGIKIDYHITPTEYETGLRIKKAKNHLDDVFLLMYCDNYCPINFEKLQSNYFNSDAKVLVTAYANREKYTSNNLLTDASGKVLAYDKTRKLKDLSCVDIGYAIVSKTVVNLISDNNLNFEETVYQKLITEDSLYITLEEHRYYSIGSWERIEHTKEFFKQKKVAFLDRDGTLNVRPPKAQYVTEPDGFVWLLGAIDAIKLLKDNGYLVIIITNQPGIARGNLSEKTLYKIHNKMLTDLRQKNVEIDAIYYCPHNWDAGCFCRKPQPGMLYEAARDYSLNLRSCVLFGDDERDIEAGNTAGCTSYKVSEKKPLIKVIQNVIEDEKRR